MKKNMLLKSVLLLSVLFSLQAFGQDMNDQNLRSYKSINLFLKVDYPITPIIGKPLTADRVSDYLRQQFIGNKIPYITVSDNKQYPVLCVLFWKPIWSYDNGNAASSWEIDFKLVDTINNKIVITYFSSQDLVFLNQEYGRISNSIWSYTNDLCTEFINKWKAQH